MAIGQNPSQDISSSTSIFAERESSYFLTGLTVLIRLSYHMITLVPFSSIYPGDIFLATK
jgi:hypothetical protein